MEPSESEAKKLALLYVEDEPETREMIAATLAEQYPGITHYTATDGAEGLKLFRERRPEVVLTDIRMPVMDGITMAREIKSLSQGAELIALTAYSDTAFLMSAIEVGFSHYVLKPTDFDRLFAAIDKSLDVYRLKRHLYEQNEQIQRFAAELERANRELEAFNYTVAHDLRKPLTVVNGYCQAIMEICGGTMDPSCLTFVKEAYNGTLRMNRLIDALLVFSQAAHAEPKREVVDLTRTAEEVAEELKLAEPGRNASFRIAGGVTVEGDANLLRVVVANLFGNAWKYTSDREEAVIEFGVVEEEGAAVFFVRDNGIGFDSSEASDLFAPFRRLPGGQRIGGLGIGLATVERIVMRHGGRVWAEGEPGKGATFYFTL